MKKKWCLNCSHYYEVLVQTSHVVFRVIIEQSWQNLLWFLFRWNLDEHQVYMVIFLKPWFKDNRIQIITWTGNQGNHYTSQLDEVSYINFLQKSHEWSINIYIYIYIYGRYKNWNFIICQVYINHFESSHYLNKRYIFMANLVLI